MYRIGISDVLGGARMIRPTIKALIVLEVLLIVLYMWMRIR